jgi:hypothetical protein
MFTTGGRMVTVEEWIKGEIISWKGQKGYVNFISPQYITMCIKEIEKDEEEALVSKRNVNQVCILIHAQYWGDVHREESK